MQNHVKKLSYQSITFGALLIILVDLVERFEIVWFPLERYYRFDRWDRA